MSIALALEIGVATIEHGHFWTKSNADGHMEHRRHRIRESVDVHKMLTE